MIIGIVEMFRQWKRYKKRRIQGFVDVSNESIWQECCREDKRKLIYAYSIWPLHEIILDYTMLSGVYKQIFPTFSDYILQIIASLTIMLGDFMLILTPTLVRFLIIRRKLKYGTEICGYLIVSLFFYHCV